MANNQEYELDFTGEEIDERLKQVSEKYGFMRLKFDDASTFYHIEAFASEDDAVEFDADPDSNAHLRLLNEPIPISTVQGDAYTAMLRTTISNTADIVVTDDKLEVPLNYRAVKITQIGNENAGYRGSVVVQTSTDGVSWNTTGTIENVLPSSEPNDATTYTTVDIGKYLVAGRQMVRLRATYSYEVDGDKKIVSSSNVIVGTSVTRTNLLLSLLTNYETPQDAVSKGSLELQYRVYGSVKKTFYLEVTGSSGVYSTTKALTADDDNASVSFSLPEDSAYGLLTHGVKKVRAWMEAEDGLGNTIKSNETVNRIMMVNAETSGADLLKPYLLLQNVDSEAVNYVQTELAQYAVYVPRKNDDGTITNDGDAINVAFLLTDYTEDYETVKPTEYFRVEQLVEPNKTYSLLTTIEIEQKNESEDIVSFDTYFRVRRIADTTSTDFMRESTGESSYYIKVDNSTAFVPVSGATFRLNPKVRNNTEENPARILNARNNNTEVESVWTNFGFINDGWITAEDGQKVLRVPAGARLEIKKSVWAQFRRTPNSSMTFEIDYAVRNVTNVSDPIIAMFEGTGMDFRGLRMNALDGWLKTASYASSNDCLFSWQEDMRTHASFNIHHQVIPNKGDVQYPSTATNVNGSIALARVLINGDIVREIPFSTTNKSEWATTDSGSIIIGNDGADIDIYSISIYEDKQIEANDILLRNYLSSRPTSEEKVEVNRRNNIMTGGRIDVEKTKAIGINCMVWHGALPYFYNQSEQEGWYEIFRYDDNGNYLPEFSGTICKQTKSLKVKGQGSTAKTYYDWNLQDDQSKVKATIQVALKDIHESIVVSEPYSGELTDDEGNVTYTGLLVDIYGGNLGKNFPLENGTQSYQFTNGMVTVPDGWIDGNGKYRGMGYMVEEGTSLAQKKVIKINYASSMQSHLLGACTTYDLLHRKVVGDTPLQKRIPTAVSAKHTAPFMLFHQAEGSANTYFKGMGNYGAGKMDKVTWGYVKKKHPMFTLIEGSDNNLPMTGFRIPFDKLTAVYSPSDEGWLYNGQQSFDFDAGATTEDLTDGWQYDGEGEAPKANIRDKWADIHNFIYLNATNIKYFNGTFTAFQASTSANDTDYKYWCTQGDNAYRLYRYDFLQNKWIDAGLLDESTMTYKTINLKTYSVTKSAYDKNISSGNFATINQAFIDAFTAFMKKYLKYFINEKSLLFNYTYVLSFLAGTDNSDKNTYYKLDPYPSDMSSDATTAEGTHFASWFSGEFGHNFNFAEVYQIFLDGDDLDSIFRTNNNSHQTKPYYIERMYPADDNDPTVPLYEGMNNQLFNFVENAYAADHKIADMMKQILVAATEIVSENDKFYGLTTDKKSVWGFLHKYFFNTQYYFPQVAYNEQARIRYEFPQLIGFISQGAGSRNIEPISQSLGSQLQNELQYMNQRLIYMASFAGFGAFGGMTGYSIGLSDANESFNFTPAAKPDGSGATYTFTVKSHQYIYPSYNIGTTTTSTHHRLKPDTAFTFTMAENVKGSDTGMGLLGINYYTYLGDMGDKSIVSETLTISGKRLKGFTSTDNSLFRPRQIKVDAPNIKDITLVSGGSELTTLDLSRQKRLETIVTGGRIISEVIYPESSVLESITVASVVRDFSIDNLPNFKTLSLSDEAKANVRKFHVGDGVGANANIFDSIINIYNKQNALGRMLVDVMVENVDWTDFSIEALEWYMDVPKCHFTGKIAIKEDDPYGNPKVTWDLKNKIIAKFGNVDNREEDFRGLLLDYKKKEFNPDGAMIKGGFYTEAGDKFQFEVRPGSVYENSHRDIRYLFATRPAYSVVTLDEEKGKLTVNSLSNQFDECVIEARVYNSTGYDAITKRIEIWDRPVQIGDYVYADGTFSSPEQYEDEKTVVGVCCYVAPRDAQGNIIEELHNPKDVMTRLMVSVDDVKAASTTEDFNSWQWGSQPANTGQNTAWNEQYALYAPDPSNASGRIALTSGGMTIYDISAITNLTSRGDLKFTEDGVEKATTYLTDEAFRDTETADGTTNGGFKRFPAGTALGDGFGYSETDNERTARTLKATSNSVLVNLAGDAYKGLGSEEMVNSGYIKTLKIIKHRNDILNNGLDQMVVNVGVRGVPSGGTTLGAELDDLAMKMSNIRAYFRDEMGYEQYYAKWSQLYYPAASACYAYEPAMKLKEGEVLADKFKRHHWFLPTDGLLARLFWYMYKCTRSVAANGEETHTVAVRENTPFAAAIGKGQFKRISTSFLWSVSERLSAYSWFVNFYNGSANTDNKYSSSVGRAIAAF